MKRMLLIALVLAAGTNLALAQTKHIGDMRVIDAALPTAKLAPAERAEVVRLRQEGEQLHYSNQHGRAEVVLERAKAILNVR
jgi:hypothetical protein